METEVVAWLLQAVATDAGGIIFELVREPARMTLEACMALGTEINNMKETPEIVMCMPAIVELGIPV